MCAHVCVRVRVLQGCVRACRRVLPGDEGSTWVRLEHVHQQQHFRLRLAVGRGARRISYPWIQSAIAVSAEVGAEIGNSNCEASGTRIAWSAQSEHQALPPPPPRHLSASHLLLTPQQPLIPHRRH